MGGLESTGRSYKEACWRENAVLGEYLHGLEEECDGWMHHGRHLGYILANAIYSYLMKRRVRQLVLSCFALLCLAATLT